MFDKFKLRRLPANVGHCPVIAHYPEKCNGKYPKMHLPRSDQNNIYIRKTPTQKHGSLKQVKGIEPSTSAWEADVLPLNYTCKTGSKSQNKTLIHRYEGSNADKRT